MKKMCCSSNYYNQLSKKQYEEYLKRLYNCYLYNKKYYEGRHNTNSKEEQSKKTNCKSVRKIHKMKRTCCSSNHYNQLSRKQYEEYLKRLYKYYLYKKKYYEGHKNTGAKKEQSKETKCTSARKIYNKHYHNKSCIPNNKSCDTIHKNQEDKCKIAICKTKVSSETLSICENSPHISDVTVGPITVKIPVVLTECNITITVESLLKLEDAVLEIKHIRKNAYLNQCKLVPNFENGKPNTGILFLDGFIRKNIEYSTIELNHKELLNGKLKEATVDVPFKCTTRVTFNTPPKFKTNVPQDKIQILQTSIGEFTHCKDEVRGRDIREQNFRLIEFLNEKVFCELISAEFIESDILENPINKECKSHHEQAFHDIHEKVILLLTIKLLQNQNVIVPK